VKIVKLTLLSTVVALNLMAIDMASIMSEVSQNNPKVIQKKKEYNSIYETLNISKGDFFLPSIDLSGGINKVKTKYTKPSGLADSEGTNKNITLSATENLFNGFGTVHDIDAKKAALASAAYSYVQTVNEQSLEAAKAYIDVVRNRDLLSIEVDNYNKHQTIMSAMSARQKSGVGVIGDIQEITAKTNLAYANYLAQSKNFKSSQIVLHKYLGRYDDANSFTAPGVGENLNYTLPQAIEFALANNPTIHVQRYNVIQARYNQKRDLNGFYPIVDLSLSKSYNDNEVDERRGDDREYTELKGGVNFKWNLFKGFKDVSLSNKNKSLIHVENEKFYSIKREVTQEIESAWMSYKMIEKEYTYLDTYVINSNAKLETITQRFKIGQKSLFEFLAAQTDYNSAQQKLINTKYDLVYAKLKVLKALGILVDMVNGNVKSEIGIQESMLHNYTQMNYVEDVLPVDENREPTAYSSAIGVDNLMSFGSYEVVSTSDCKVAAVGDEVYQEEYVAAPKISQRKSQRYKLKSSAKVYTKANGRVLETFHAGTIITGYSDGGWIRVTGIAKNGWKKYNRTGYIRRSRVSR